MNKMIKMTIKANDRISRDIQVFYKGKDMNAFVTSITLVTIKDYINQDKILSELLKVKG